MATTETKKEKYIEAVGRRKTSVARVRLFEVGAGGVSFGSKADKGDSSGGHNTFIINEKTLEAYFPIDEMQAIAKEALKEATANFKISAHIKGGGVHSQSEALRHGIARALVKFNSDLRRPLKKEGMLKRDPRTKERRKFGLKKARKAPQWSKR